MTYQRIWNKHQPTTLPSLMIIPIKMIILYFEIVMGTLSLMIGMLAFFVIAMILLLIILLIMFLLALYVLFLIRIVLVVMAAFILLLLGLLIVIFVFVLLIITMFVLVLPMIFISLSLTIRSCITSNDETTSAGASLR